MTTTHRGSAAESTLSWPATLGVILALFTALILSGCGGADDIGAGLAGTQVMPTPSSSLRMASACTGSLDLPMCRPPSRDALSEAQGFTPNEEAAFAWAEGAYPEFFSPSTKPGVPPLTSGAFAYRYYAATGNYLGMSGDSLYVMGPMSGGQLLYVGQIADFTCRIVPVACQTSASALLAGLDGQSLPSLGTLSLGLAPEATRDKNVKLTFASGAQVQLKVNADGRYQLPLVADRMQALVTVADPINVLYYAKIFVEPALAPAPAGAVLRGYLRASLEAAQAVLPLIPASHSDEVTAAADRVAFLRDTLAMVDSVIQNGSAVVEPGGTTITAADLRVQDLVIGYALQQTSTPLANAAVRQPGPASGSLAEDIAYRKTVSTLADLEGFNNVAQATIVGVAFVGGAMVIVGATPIIVGGVVIGGLVELGGAVSLIATVNSVALDAAVVADKTYYGDVSGFSRKDEIISILTNLTTSIGLPATGIESGLKSEVIVFVDALPGGPYPRMAAGIASLTNEGWSKGIDAALGASYLIVFGSDQPPSPPAPPAGPQLLPVYPNLAITPPGVSFSIALMDLAVLYPDSSGGCTNYSQPIFENGTTHLYEWVECNHVWTVMVTATDANCVGSGPCTSYREGPDVMCEFIWNTFSTTVPGTTGNIFAWGPGYAIPMQLHNTAGIRWIKSGTPPPGYADSLPILQSAGCHGSIDIYFTNTPAFTF